MDDYIDKVIEIICNRIYAGQNDIENQELGELTKTLVELINAKANLNSSKRMFEGSEQKVRMLFQQIREQYDELEHLRGADDAKKNNNISSGLEVKLNIGNLSQSNSDDIFWIHEKTLELLGRSISSN